MRKLLDYDAADILFLMVAHMYPSLTVDFLRLSPAKEKQTAFLSVPSVGGFHVVDCFPYYTIPNPKCKKCSCSLSPGFPSVIVCGLYVTNNRDNNCLLSKIFTSGSAALAGMNRNSFQSLFCVSIPINCHYKAIK